EEPRPLGRPVAARARAVLLAGDDDERNALLLVAHRRIVDRHLLARGEVARVAALAPRHEAVSEPHVRKRAAHHDLVVAPPRAVAVEVARLDATLEQVLARRAVSEDRARRRDVVRRDAVAQ